MILNTEQKRIVEYEPNGHMQVKGVAGSGKTTICVHRVPFLLTHYCYEEDDRVLLVTYNKTLLNYLEHQYNDYKETIGQTSFFKPDETKLSISNVDKLMYSYFVDYQSKHNLKLDIAHTFKTRSAMKKAILLTQEKYPDVKILNTKNLKFFENEIEWMKACDIQSVEVYQNINRLGRANGLKGVPQKLLKNSPTREAIFSLMQRYDEILEKEKLIDFKTMNQMALQEARNRKPIYTHIIIDECQDLTKVQLEFLRCLFNDEKSYASIMFVADNTQSIYSHSWLGKGRSFTTLGFDMKGRSRTLSKNYRTTAEIAKAAFSIIEKDEEIKNNIDYVKPSMIDRHGHEPIYHHFAGFEDQLDYVVKQIKNLKKEYALSDMCVVARTKNILTKAHDYLQKEHIESQIINKNKFDFLSESVRLTTMHSIKGLEFKVVFLIELSEDVIPNMHACLVDDDKVFEVEEKKLLYVGMTRAKELLFMTSSQTPSKFMKEIDPQYLRSHIDCRLRPYYAVPIQNYFFKEKLVDLHSSEEMVRQWMIQEVLENYEYEKEMLEIEYPVQSFSKTGYVDLCIHIFVENQKRPYIFFEFKNMATDLELALKQLKSYMHTEEHVQYGVISNGLETVMINREGEQISDIPMCQSHFLPDLKKKRRYIDFINHQTFTYLEDEKEDTLEIIDEAKDVSLNSESFLSIPHLGNVSDVSLSQQDESEKETICIPSSWCLDVENTYLLEASGDSMRDVGILDGDLVLVNQQEQVEQGDIVVVTINDQVMIKEFLPMGSYAILISKNNKYEPIHMSLEDVSFHGKVLGVLQKNR